MKKLFTIALCTLSGLIFAENMGVRVIQPGGQTHEANIRHQKMCEEMGGVDVTNEGTSTLSTGAIDGVVCDMKDKKNIDKKVLNNKESIVYRQGESYNLSSSNQKIIRFNNLGAAIMHLLAPEETVKYGTNFTAMGVAQYSDFPAGVILSEVAVPVDQCAFGNQRSINGDAQVQLAVLCQAKIQESVQSHMKGCWNSQCNYAYGVIQQY